MKIKKGFLIFLVSLMVMSVTGLCLASGKPVIKEIVIIGPSRSNEDIIIRHLPFNTGDEWQDDYLEITEKRIKALNIFNHLELKVLTEPVSDNGIRVVIRANDTSIYYVDPVEFAIMKTVYLSEQMMRQEFRNPFGNGINLEAGYGWGSAPWWSLGLQYAGSKGFTGKIQHYNFERSSLFNGIKYSEDGNIESISLKQIPAANLELNYSLNYLDNNYKVSGKNSINQQYLVSGIEAVYGKIGKLRTSYQYGKPLKSDLSSYSKIVIDYTLEKKFDYGDLIYRLHGGIMSAKAPLNLKFHGGGFNKISLRGYRYNMAGDRFLRTTIEFHKPIITEDMKIIFFTDIGKIAATGINFADKKWLYSGGIGLSYDTPMNIPVRLDIATNPEGDIQWNIGFGHSF